MLFFDSNCCLGRLSVPLPECIDSAKELAGKMKRAGIDEALVYHAFGREYSPEDGNRRLMDEVRGVSGLHACWCVMTHHTGEMPPPADLVGAMRESGVRAARIFPKTHNWPLSEWSAGGLLDALEERAVPLFIDLGETGCDQVHSLCGKHPRLPVVLTGVPFRLSREVYALLAGTSNLYIETSLFQLHGGIEDVCARFGPGRLLFGTAAPHFSASPSVMAVKYAAIPEEQKAMIAGGNLRRLLQSAV